MEPSIPILVAAADAGTRLDSLLARELHISRGYVRRLLGLERILLEGNIAQKGTILRAGDRLEVLAFRHPDSGPQPEPAIELSVLARGHGLIAVDKPAGLPGHPLDFEETRTALNAVLALCPEMSGVGEGGLASGMVHRIDTHTSGVLVFATDSDAWTRARRAFDERRVEKRYVARVHGRFDLESEVRLRLDGRGQHMRVVERGGRVAISHIAPIEAGDDTSLVEIRPVTGLRHQIRVTLAHLGVPVLGDKLYGSDAELERHLLHAESIRIDDFEARSPLPSEFRG